MKDFNFKHGGNIYYHAKNLNVFPSEIIDASASLVPFSPPSFLINSLYSEIEKEGFRYYPERNHEELRDVIGRFHNINPNKILAGNGASELITWIGFEASKRGINALPIPGFLDYERSLNCWDGKYIFDELPKLFGNINSQPFPIKPLADVIWITNPHNPTGQLWRRDSLELILKNYKLVICDEAFLSITPKGEKESLVPLIENYENLIIIRSLTKLFNIAGLRLGYIIGSQEILKRLNSKRDPWPLNSFAINAGKVLLNDKDQYDKWTAKIHNWINVEKDWLIGKLSRIKSLKVHNSSTNYFLIQSKNSLSPNIQYLEKRGILIRECSSFKSLDERWGRISLQTHKKNKKMLEEIQKSFKN